MKNLKIHTEIEDGDCPYGHEAFYFVRDLTMYHALAVENKSFYECICLKCGYKDTFQVTDSMAKRIVYPRVTSYDEADFYKVHQFIEDALEVPGITLYDAVETINIQREKERPKVKEISYLTRKDN